MIVHLKVESEPLCSLMVHRALSRQRGIWVCDDFEFLNRGLLLHAVFEPARIWMDAEAVCDIHHPRCRWCKLGGSFGSWAGKGRGAFAQHPKRVI
jgi:hypothetical protein